MMARHVDAECFPSSGNWRGRHGLRLQRLLGLRDAAVNRGLPIRMGHGGSLRGLIESQCLRWTIKPLQKDAADSHLREEALFFRGIRLRELPIFAGGALQVRLSLQLTAKIEPNRR